MALQWRFDNFDQFEPKETSVQGMRARTQQILSPLFNIAALLGPEYSHHLTLYAQGTEEQARQVQLSTPEAMLLQAFVNRQHSARLPTCKDLADEVLAANGADDTNLRKWLHPKAASAILQELGFSTRKTNRGAEVQIQPERLADLVARFDIKPETTGVFSG